MRSRRSTGSSTALAGSLLLAHPSLRDPHFRHTVILLSAHDEGGAMGVVLNRPLRRSLGQLGGDFALGPLVDVPLFEGGPVQREQLVLCAWEPHPAHAELRITFGLDPAKAAEMRGQPEVCLRGFLGYAGWSGGQLEDELGKNAWVPCPVTANSLALEPGEPMWRGLLGRIDHQWRLLADEPEDSSRN
jgi:putative transcriptional regulator